MKVFVTGAAGFIGGALSLHLLSRGDEVVAIDDINPYYDVRLKYGRLKRLEAFPRFRFYRGNIADSAAVERIFETERPQRVVNLAAQAGVRYSLTNPHVYVESNIKGFLNILEGCRHYGVEALTYASSSSVYGANQDLPFSENRIADHPVALYGATKRSNELMAHAYSHLFQIPTTGLRFFSVYGPWGRPDMALFLFTQKILAGEPIDIFNHGDHLRDFTFIDDLVEGVTRVLDAPAKSDLSWDAKNPSPATSQSPFRIYNIGNSNQVHLEELISAVEEALGKKAIRNYLPAQPGDVRETLADLTRLENDFGFRPRTTIQEGVRRFIDWYQTDYRRLAESTPPAFPSAPVEARVSIPSV